MPELIGATAEEEQGMSATSEDGGDNSTITVDQIVELLNSPRRRAVLGCMESRGTPGVRWEELVRCVTEAEAGPEWTEQERKRVQISLHQNHVPALERAGVVVERRDAEDERYVATGPHYSMVVRAQEALNEAATNRDGGDGFLGRFF